MEDNLLNEIVIEDSKDKMVLFDQTDRPFLLFYLIIFILSIILTLIAI